jgi:transposase InsO family protein
MLILSAAHLRAALTEYQAHYNTARPHQGIAQRVPGGRHDTPVSAQLTWTPSGSTEDLC